MTRDVDFEIGADISPLKRGLAEATRDVKIFGVESSDSVSGLASIFVGVESRLVALSGALASIAFGAGIQSAIDQADALDEMSERTGIAIESLAALRFAGQQSGVGLEKMGDSVKKLGKLMVEAGAGNEEARRSLLAFGVTLGQIKTTDVQGAFRNIADTISRLPEVSRQGALENLAKGFGELVPLLKGGSAGIDELTKKAKDLGVVDGYVAAGKAAGDYNDAVDRLRDTLTGVAQRTAASVLPTLTDTVDELGKLTLAAEENSAVMRPLGTVVLGAVLTNSLRNLTLSLSASVSGWFASVQAARQDASAKVAAASSSAASSQAIRTHSALLLAEAEAAVASASGMNRLSVVQNALIPARQRLSAATEAAAFAERSLVAAKAEAASKTTILGAAMGALGGPLGAVVTLIGIGATAWAAFGRDGISAVAGVTQEIERGREVLARYKREQKFGGGDEGQLRASLEAIESRIATLSQSSGASAGAAVELAKARKEAEALQAALDDIEKRKGGVGVLSAGSDAALKDLLKKLQKPDIKKDEKKSNADPSMMPYYEAGLAEAKRVASEQNALREYTKGEELAYWQTLLSAAQLGSKDRLAIEKKVADLTVQIRREAAKETVALEAEASRSRDALAIGHVDAARAAAQAALDLEQITKVQMAELEVKFEADRFAIQKAALQERLLLSELDPNASPVELARIKNELLEIEQKHQTNVITMQGQLRLAQKQAALESLQIWSSLGDRMSGLWDKGIQAMMNGTLTWRNGLRAVGAELVGWFATDVVGSMIKSWLAGEVKKLAIKMGFLGQEVAAQTTASTTTMAVKGTETAVVSGGNAVKAGTGAAAALASIPFVGPVLALAAMATVFAAVSSLAGKTKSAAKGYDIPKGINPMVQTHEEEMILPAKYANAIRSMTNGGAQEIGGAAFSPSISVHAMDSRDVARTLRKGGALHTAIRGLRRDFVKV